jgi:hypothetical protein
MRSVTLLSIAIASSIGCVPCSELCAEPGYKSKSGKIAFQVDTNVPFLKVSGSSSGVTGGGEASVAGEVATIRNLRFEVHPKTFKTGIGIRDHKRKRCFGTYNLLSPQVTAQALLPLSRSRYSRSKSSACGWSGLACRNSACSRCT